MLRLLSPNPNVKKVYKPMSELYDDAKQLATNISNDISNASSRIEHIRLTQLALEAERLVKKIESLET